MGHKLFCGWLQGSEGKPLWVSADTGCGKSVLAQYLVEDVIQTTEARTTCYFFKDDFKEQKSAANAISCLLHQILLNSPSSSPMLSVPDSRPMAKLRKPYTLSWQRKRH